MDSTYLVDRYNLILVMIDEGLAKRIILIPMIPIDTDALHHMSVTH